MGYGILAWLKHILLMYEPEKIQGREGRRKRREEVDEESGASESD